MHDATSTSIGAVTKRRYRSLEEKLQIVQEALVAGASVAAVARAHDVNANLVFHWRKLYRAGLLAKPGVRFLPVKVEEEEQKRQKHRRIARSATEESGTIEVQLVKAQVRIAGNVNGTLVRTVLECLQG